MPIDLANGDSPRPPEERLAEFREFQAEVVRLQRGIRPWVDVDVWQPTGHQDDGVIASARDAVQAALTKVRSEHTGLRGSEIARLCDLALTLEHLVADREHARISAELTDMVGVRQAVNAIPAGAGLDEALLAVARLTPRLTRLHRVLIYKMVGEELRAIDAHDPRDAPAEPSVCESAKSAPIPIHHGYLETRAVHDRLPALITGLASDPDTFSPLVDITHTRSYVVIPVIAHNMVVATVHADTFYASDDPDASIRDQAADFVAQLRPSLERAHLVDQLAAERRELRRLAARTTSQVDEVMELHTNRATPAAARRPAGGAGRPAWMSDLTERERQVLRLVAGGLTNKEIAESLVISDETVKSHVKRVLRKASARDRAQLTSLVLRGAGPDLPPA